MCDNAFECACVWIIKYEHMRELANMTACVITYVSLCVITYVQQCVRTHPHV